MRSKRALTDGVCLGCRVNVVHCRSMTPLMLGSACFVVGTCGTGNSCEHP
jgi:hypothetical protein